jgi:hypothetical protein
LGHQVGVGEVELVAEVGGEVLVGDGAAVAVEGEEGEF